MNNKILQLMNEYNTIENELNVCIDDVLHKVTQEVSEVFEANLTGIQENIDSEIGDVIINIYSIIYSLELNVTLSKSIEYKDINPGDLLINLGNFNTAIQKYRHKYARCIITRREVENIVTNFLILMISYLREFNGLHQIINQCLIKFKSRKYDYII